MWTSPSLWTSDVNDWSPSISNGPYSFSNTWSPIPVLDNNKSISMGNNISSPSPIPTMDNNTTPVSDFVNVSNTFSWQPSPSIKQAPIPIETTQPRQVKKIVPSNSIEEEISGQNLYKTELCRSYEDTGSCRYGTKCQFAHGKEELRPVLRHPKYKTEICKTFFNEGTCPYGRRCRFIHSTAPDVKVSNVVRTKPSLPKPHISTNNRETPSTTTKFYMPNQEIISPTGFVNISNSQTNWEPSPIVSSSSKSTTSPQLSPTQSTQSWIETHMGSLSISSPSSELVQLIPEPSSVEEKTSRGSRLSFFESISSTK